MGVRRPVRLLRSLDHSMPMAFGIRTPTILIPAIADTWSDDRRRAVLLHELAHIDRRDCLTQLLAEATCIAYWMHPAVWLVAERLKVEREVACDDRVLTVGTAAGDYVSEALGVGYLTTGIVFGAVIAVIAIGHFAFKMNAILAFWLAYIFTRPLGASLGDLLSQPTDYGGMGFGTTTTSLMFLAVIASIVVYMTVMRRSGSGVRA